MRLTSYLLINFVLTQPLLRTSYFVLRFVALLDLLCPHEMS